MKTTAKGFIFCMIAFTMIWGQDYVGSDNCGTCHYAIYSDWNDSGHPYKFSITEGNTGPEYPDFVTNFQSTWMDYLANGSLDWSNIAGVIGGFGWKTRFVGTDGHLIGTAGSSLAGSGEGHNQFNFFGGEEHGWVDYHPNDIKIYNYGCFKCHTTGGTTEGTWLPGVEDLGTFTEGGIGCESCHGPGGDHIGAPTTANIDLVYEFAHLDNSIGGLDIDGVVHTPDPDGDDVNFLCGTCHNRSYTSPINSENGFIKHHEQWDEFVATRHGDMGFNCSTCHDPHKRTIWDGDAITTTCQTCHSAQATTTNHGSSATCLDCHMPYAAKSGTTRGASGYKGDVRSHLMAITVNSESMFTEDGLNVRDDEERPASLSPAYSCLGCHNDDPSDGIPDKTLEEAVASAGGMHSSSSIANAGQIPEKFYLHQNYPNPFNPDTKIVFDMSEKATVNLSIYDIQGNIVDEIVSGTLDAGQHVTVWDGRTSTGGMLPSGIYIARLAANADVQTIKMLLTK